MYTEYKYNLQKKIKTTHNFITQKFLHINNCKYLLYFSMFCTQGRHQIYLSLSLRPLFAQTCVIILSWRRFNFCTFPPIESCESFCDFCAPESRLFLRSAKYCPGRDMLSLFPVQVFHLSGIQFATEFFSENPHLYSPALSQALLSSAHLFPLPALQTLEMERLTTAPRGCSQFSGAKVCTQCVSISWSGLPRSQSRWQWSCHHLEAWPEKDLPPGPPDSWQNSLPCCYRIKVPIFPLTVGQMGIPASFRGSPHILATWSLHTPAHSMKCQSFLRSYNLPSH